MLAPLIQKIEPGLHSALGFMPLFGAPQTTGLSVFTAGLVLTLMILPIIASLCRDLFLTVPTELKDGAEALGATRWEVIRGIVLPSTISGVSGRHRTRSRPRAWRGDRGRIRDRGRERDPRQSCFSRARRFAERIANQFPSPDNPLHTASMFYAGLILLVICLLTSLGARAIAGRFDVARRYGMAVAG